MNPIGMIAVVMMVSRLPGDVAQRSSEEVAVSPKTVLGHWRTLCRCAGCRGSYRGQPTRVEEDVLEKGRLCFSTYSTLARRKQLLEVRRGYSNT